MTPFYNFSNFSRTTRLASIIALSATIFLSSSGAFAQSGTTEDSDPAFFLQDAIKPSALQQDLKQDLRLSMVSEQDLKKQEQAKQEPVKALNPLEDIPSLESKTDVKAEPVQAASTDASATDLSSTDATSSTVQHWTTTPLPILDGLDLDFTLDRYQVKWPEGETWTIRVQKANNNEHASILINDQEVMKFRSGLDSLDAYDRAHIVAQRLFQYLSQMPKQLSIRPDVQNGESLIKAGDIVLTRIDLATAEAAQNSPKTLATVWSNQIRESLGMDPLAPVLPDLSQFRGEMSKKYHLPLAVDFYDETGKSQSGMASWYGPYFHGRRAADGSRFDMNRMTAAHKHLPFGTVVKVTNQRNGRSCVVQITDRGPYAHGRVIDLSKAAANAIGMLGSGVAKVKLEVLTPRKSSGAISSQKLSSRS